MDNTSQPSDSYGWCLIPLTILARDDLSPRQKLILGIILGHLTPKNYCYASNAWLARQGHCTKDTISNTLSQLAKSGIIQTKITYSAEGQIIERRIYPERALITLKEDQKFPFNTQLPQNPNTLAADCPDNQPSNSKVKKYLLKKSNGTCAYCGIKVIPLDVEHIVPRNPRVGPNGTNHVSNLTLSCKQCNKDKRNKQPEEWLQELQRSKESKDRLRANNLETLLKDTKNPSLS